ncbi:MAG: AAA family ATPase [Verrucomicrobia bacterium]|nr:AAA family ATPase [Verrucomicrobiota bacterium]
MHTLAHISISNFRSCKNVSLPLGDFTPVVGYNNAGESNILTAIEWRIDPFTFNAPRFSKQVTFGSSNQTKIMNSTTNTRCD